MSCNYADGLSAYENKGVLGLPENFDNEAEINEKCEKLVQLIENAKHVVVHTGAGISTSAGIPDFRGPNGVWTLEKKGEKPNVNISFDDAVPTKTHMALKALIDKGYVHYIVSQNIDGLHLKSGLERKYLSELHGNMFIEQCNKCKKQFIRETNVPTVGLKLTGGTCKGGRNSRSCRGFLIDNILDWEHNLPEEDFQLAYVHSTIADLNITLGTTLQIIPSGSLPKANKSYGGKLVICNLQPTKLDKKADLKISTYVDDILMKVIKRLGIELPEYNSNLDPTKNQQLNIDWTLGPEHVQGMKKFYSKTIKHSNKRKSSDNLLNDTKIDIKKSLIKKDDEEKKEIIK